MVNTQVLQVAISNLPDLENHLFHLYIEINGVIHDFMPDISDMPELEDITNEDDI